MATFQINKKRVIRLISLIHIYKIHIIIYKYRNGYSKEAKRQYPPRTHTAYTIIKHYF